MGEQSNTNTRPRAERRVRPIPEREHPFRQAAQILDKSRASAGDHTQGADDVEDGVRSIYRVAERYLAEGTEWAAKLGALSYAPLGTGGDTGDIISRLSILSSDLLANWFELLGVMSDALLSAGDRAVQHRDPAPATTAATAAMPVETRHALRILGEPRACAVSVRLDAAPADAPLHCAGLLAPGAGAPIAATVTRREDGLLVVELTLTTATAAGRYHGVIVAGDSPCGLLACEIIE